MGSGSDVAREAADMVLLEDFSAIVIALEWGAFTLPSSVKRDIRMSDPPSLPSLPIAGRLVYDNLKKTILYLLLVGR
jgi:sodium/potassium-transporting ATPase subunit alpha